MDTEALIAAAQSGKLSGVGLDVLGNVHVRLFFITLITTKHILI